MEVANLIIIYFIYTYGSEMKENYGYEYIQPSKSHNKGKDSETRNELKRKRNK